MALSASDSRLYYDLWKPLLDFVNKKYHINDLKNIVQTKHLDVMKVKEIADYIWAHTSVIDKYLQKQNSLTEEEKEIVASWKRCISGRFILGRNLKKGSVFIHMETDQVYLVSGIITSFEEMFSFLDPPIMLEATLIPFKDVIITDGICFPYQITFGPGARGMMKDTYMEAKKSRRLITKI